MSERIQLVSYVLKQLYIVNEVLRTLFLKAVLTYLNKTKIINWCSHHFKTSLPVDFVIALYYSENTNVFSLCAKS